MALALPFREQKEGSIMATPGNQSWEAEYKEAGMCFRTYMDFLTKIVAGFCTTNAILFVALTYLVRDKLEPRLSVVLIALVGILACVGAFVIQRRTYAYWLLHVERASDLERRHDAQLYTRIFEHAKSCGLKSCHVVQIVYVVFALFWLVVFLKVIGVSAISIEL
jgi:putative intracellular protease/amidase